MLRKIDEGRIVIPLMFITLTWIVVAVVGICVVYLQDQPVVEQGESNGR